MGTDHGKKKVKTPLKKPKVIDKIKTQSAKTTVSDAQKRKQTKKSSKKTTVTDTQKRGQTKTQKSSKKTTITDTQKRGQVGTRYNLRVGKKSIVPKKETGGFRKAFNAYIEKMKIKFTSEDFDRAAKKSVGDKIVQMIKDYEK